MTKKVTIDIAKTSKDLEAILTLQLRNHRDHLLTDVHSEKGFVTIRHELEQLEEMSQKAPQVIGRSGEELIAYALVLLKENASMFPELGSMFRMFDQTKYRGKFIGQTSYYVMGQICIAEEFRGKGVFQGLYAKHEQLLSQRFDLCLTEVSLRNTPSIKAHKKVGFEVIKEHSDEIEDWAIMAWDWSLDRL